MSSTPRFIASERPAQLQASLNAVGSWMLATHTDTGWNELVLEVKPAGASFFVRVSQSYEDRDVTGEVHLLASDEPIVGELSRLQDAAFDEVEGSWFSATIVVAAKGWPTPQYQVGAAYNRTEEPRNWDGEGGLSNRDLREHFEKYPRTTALPTWAELRLNRGRSVPITEITGEDVPNPYLVEALQAFGAEHSEAALVNVVRQLMGGEVLLDATDSEFVAEGDNPFGPETQVNYSVIRFEGYRALCAFSSSETALASHREKGREGTPVLTQESSLKVFLDVLSRTDIDMLVLDPGTPQMCVIEGPQIQWVLQVPSNAIAKTALMNQNMQALLSALAAPSAFLLMGIPQGPSDRLPLVIDGGKQEGQTLLTFTSAAEASALDPTLEVTSASALDVLKFAVDAGVDSVRINGLNPYATLPIAQVKELVELVEATSLKAQP